ncbi:sulfotransferase domain-containing protein [Roseitranquillus sediminis]|uniref:sulfotransferase domain-containing protein n=1 Tax=Roseitranquillus sediminis TaxID=2809051 RepID=UPI001D0CB2A8|nr:sulfotransferase domain-containing protein [Roseitranquillus sediminis]MBM9594074.1 sulfotransferase domain-containing protein [Roseitranquillus sediminis]
MSSDRRWLQKARELHNHHFDSTVWNGFAFRPDDVVIATYAKFGTTWTPQIVGQLVFGGDPSVKVVELSPWLDLRVPEKKIKLDLLEAQTHRRFVKTHLPVDVARGGRDVMGSMHNHHVCANDLWYRLINDTPGRVGPPIERPRSDVRAYFLDWLDGNGYPFWPFCKNFRSWWAIRDLPNVLLLYYPDMEGDLPGWVARIARFLDIPVDNETMQRVLEHASFAWMKAHADDAAPLEGVCWNGGAGDFIHECTNGRWRDVLTSGDCDRYEQCALAELGTECARWLAEGARGQSARAA